MALSVVGHIGDIQGAFFIISNEKINAKIARAYQEKLPYMLVVGPKEAESNTVNVRIQGLKESKTVRIEDFLEMAKCKIAEKNIDLDILII